MKAFTRLGIAASLACLISAGGTVAFPHFRAQDSFRSIRQRVEKINKNQRKYRRVRKELTGFSTEGGQLVAYFDGKSIPKIVATYYGESGKADEEFYYLGGKLIFVFRKDARYDSYLSGRVAETKESRFYFSNDRLIKWIDEDGKEVSRGNEEFRDKQKEYLDTAAKFASAARSKRKVIEET